MIKLSKEAESIALKVGSLLKKFYPEQNPKLNYRKYLEKTELMQILNDQQDSIVLLIDVKKFEIIYFGGSLENFIGYSLNEMSENSLLNIISLLSNQFQYFPAKFAAWILNLLKTLPSETKQKQLIYSWGWQMTHRDGRIIKTYFSLVPIELDENQNPLLIMISLRDISYMLKGDIAWKRAIFGDNEKKVFICNWSDEKTLQQDIISEREKEILKYISQGQDSKEIAQILNISSNTVDNHRRNMLARTGTRDTTALIHLCRMMNIL